MLYRILTEDKNKEQVMEIVSSFFEGYTVFSALGVWKRQVEKSLIIEIDSQGLHDGKVVEEIARRIKELNSQEAVMIQRIKSRPMFV